MRVPTLSDCREAAQRLVGRVHRTPVLTSASLNDELGAELFFKCENLQRTGSFKIRGATNAVLQLPDDVTVVATHSSGNHGAALARAARDAGKRALVVMPESSVASKVEAVRAYDGDVVFCGPLMADREAALTRVVDQHGASVVPPYDDVRVIAGQSTLAAELIEQVPNLDAVVLPVGGGGMAAGCAIVLSQTNVRLILAEPNLADDAQRSLATGVRQPPLPPRTIADGLRAGLGAANFEVLKAADPTVVTVGEDAIRDAQSLIARRLKLVAEPSGSVPLAVTNQLLAGRELAGQRIGVVISGGNV